MQDYQSQSPVKWECQYHIVWCPKYRQKKLCGKMRRRFGEIAHDLCRQKGVDELIEGQPNPTMCTCACTYHPNIAFPAMGFGIQELLILVKV
ncbi:MAG: hypothetical protein HN416_13900 [Nitrospina sp.]|jgi:hypothetical protein|nr:hypothetical protein [Nitrospina sp.]